MTLATDTFAMTAAGRTSAGTVTPAARVLIVAIALQLALAVPSVVAAFFDERLINGISVWSKPLKFQASISLMLATLLILLPSIEERARKGRGVHLAALMAAITGSMEIIYITLQAARGRASHFNSETGIETIAYSVMGAGAALLVLSGMAIGLYLLLRPAPDAPRGLRIGGGWGLVLGSILTLVTAFVLGSGEIDGPGHWVGGVKTDEGGLFLFGWSRTGGDLRVPHFFATHVMQALPLLGWLLDRTAPRLIGPGIAAGALLSVGVVAATFAQAVAGRPFL